MKKYVKFESSDGEIHFEECKAIVCLNDKKYNVDEALELAKKDANKPLFLNKKNPSS